MSVMLRGDHWHYRVQAGKKRISGPCVGCRTEAQARAYEEQKKRALLADIEFEKQADADVRRNRTVAALVENYRMELSGGSLIALGDAYALASRKPSKRVSESSYAALRETYWNDFASFMAATYPDVTALSSVRKSHCEAYVSYLMRNGRFVREKNFKPSRSGITHGTWTVPTISPKTIREIVCVCKGVFTKLEEDAGLSRNPWTGVVLPENTPTERELFSKDELKLIWDGLQSNSFCRPLFIIAANSGLTEGDICTLKWSDVDFLGGMIRRTRRKTGAQILLPLLPELVAYLKSLPRTGEYVLPEHAELYLSHQALVSARVKGFLDNLGIESRRTEPGRKAVSVKDLHSMRHIFCYRARKAGIPEHVIAKYVGHKVVEMTRHYADHDTEDDLRAQIQKLPALFVGERGDNQGEVERERLMELIPQLPIEVVRRWLGELSQGLPGTP